MTSLIKKKFTAQILQDRDKFELLLNKVGYTRRMTLNRVAGKWSIKDVLAVIWANEQYIADRMHEIAHNQRYTPCKTESALDAFLDENGYPDFGSPLLEDDSPSEWVIERFKNVSLEEIVAQEIEAFVSIVSLLEDMDETTINHHNLYQRITRHTVEQYRVHAREIKHWLKSNGVQLK